MADRWHALKHFARESAERIRRDGSWREVQYRFSGGGRIRNHGGPINLRVEDAFTMLRSETLRELSRKLPPGIHHRDQNPHHPRPGCHPGSHPIDGREELGKAVDTQRFGHDRDEQEI
jgi:hypothetical protein